MKENFAGYSIENLINTKINCACKECHFINAELFYGNFIKNIKLVMKNFPYSKVALICTENSFESFGKSLIDFLKKEGIVPLSIIVNNLSDKVEDLSKLFCLPEDLRCVITFDIDLVNALSYFAFVKQIPLIFIPTSVNVKGVFNNKIRVTVDGKEDKIKITTKKYIIIDEKLLVAQKKDLLTAYLNALTSLVSVIDLRVNKTIFSKKLCENCLELINNSIFAIMNNLSKKRSIKLIEEGLKLDIANNFLEDELYNSSYFAVEKVQKALGEVNNLTKITTVFALLELYKIYFSKKQENILSVPNYIEDIEELSKITNQNEIDLLRRVKENLPNFFEFENKLKKHNAKLLKKINAILKRKRKFVKIFNALLEETETVDYELIKKSIYYAPYFMENYTTLSLLREKGILENL